MNSLIVLAAALQTQVTHLARAESLLVANDTATAVEWLRGLGEVDWTLSHAHPTLGSLRAGDLLLSWVTHDALHLRQLARRMLENAAAAARPFSGDYAGPW